MEALWAHTPKPTTPPLARVEGTPGAGLVVDQGKHPSPTVAWPTLF